MEKKFQKSSKKFYCKKCDYSSNRESQWRCHLSTTKHKMDNMDNVVDNIKSTKRSFECVCGKVYKYNSGLSKHKKKCLLIMKEPPSPKLVETTTTSSSKSGLSVEVLNKLVEQNNTLMEKVIELSNIMIEHFLDNDNGGFFIGPKD